MKMQREIKFRAWDGKSIMKELPAYLEPHDLNETINSMVNEGIILMQYTGIKDKNSKEIYEGDICKLIFAGGNFEYIAKICWGGLGWTERCIKDSGTNMGGYWPMTIFEFFKECEVIGNIYENPELLNENTTSK